MVIQGLDGSVEFRFLRPDAQAVCLAGDFNRWQDGVLSMERGEGGWWSTRLNLAPGVYQFRYQADGAWFNDYAAFGLEMSPFGWNSVLWVDEPASSIAAPEPVVTQEAARREPAVLPVKAASDQGGDRQAA